MGLGEELAPGAAEVRWKITEPGTKRIVQRFAWLPERVGNTWVWLEFFFEEQEWTRFLTIDPYTWVGGRRSMRQFK